MTGALAKHVAGTPLSDAERKQRVDAARARWAAVGAGVAGAAAAAGVGAAAAGGTVAGRILGARLASKHAAAAVQTRMAQADPTDAARREVRIGRQWVNRRRGWIGQALKQRKSDAIRFVRPVSEEAANLANATGKLATARHLWRVERSRLLLMPESGARTVALAAHDKKLPKPPRISGVARHLRFIDAQQRELPGQIAAIDARLGLDFDHPNAPSGNEERHLGLARKEYQRRLAGFSEDRKRLVEAKPVGNVSRKGTTVTRRTASWTSSVKPKATAEQQQHRLEAANTRRDYEAVREKLRPLAEQQRALADKLQAGEITRDVHDAGIRFIQSDPAWATKKEIERRSSFFSAFRRKGVARAVPVEADVGKTWERRGGRARASHRDLTKDELAEIARGVRERADRVAARAVAHAERVGPTRMGSGQAFLARYRASIAPRILAAAQARGAHIGGRVGLAAGLGAALAGVGGYLWASSGSNDKLGKAFDEARHKRDQDGRFAPSPMPGKNDPPRVTLLVGQPGSGKSTWRALRMAQDAVRPTTVISTDDQVQAVAHHRGLTYSQAYLKLDVDQLERQQRAVMTNAMKAGHDVIVDRTNLTKKSRARTMKDVPAHYERHAVVFDVDEPELARRRAARPGKIIPARVVTDMRSSYQAPEPGEFIHIHRVTSGCETSQKPMQFPVPDAGNGQKAAISPSFAKLGTSQTRRHQSPHAYRLAKAAPRKRRTRAEVVSSAEDQVAERLAATFGKLKDVATQKMLEPDGVSLHQTMLDGFDQALKPLDAAAAAGAREPVPVTTGGERPRTIAFSMASRSPAVDAYVSSYRQDRVVALADEQRDAIKEQLIDAARTGASPQQMARRIKETIGLAPSQMEHVNNYRAELEQLQPNALRRALRDKRFDGPITRAMETGEVLPADQVDRYVDAYHRRYLAYRATTIARTEGVGAANNGQLASARAYLEAHPDYTAFKTWIAKKDERTRHDHYDLNGQEVEGLDTPFVCDSGDEIRWPHDPDAPARQIINCRCSFGIRIVPRAGMDSESAAESDEG